MHELLARIPTILTFVAFLGLVTIYLRGSRDKGTIESQGRSITALETEREILTRQLVEVNAKVTALEQAKEVLEGVANSSQQIADFRAEVITIVGALTGSLTEHHGQAMTGLERIHTDLVALGEAR